MINHPTPDLFTGRVLRIAPTWAIGPMPDTDELPLDPTAWPLEVPNLRRGADTWDRYDAYVEAWWRREARWFYLALGLGAIDPCCWAEWVASGSAERPLDLHEWAEVA